MIKKLFGVFLLVVFSFLTGCSKDIYEDNIYSENRSLKKISFNEFKNNSVAYEKFQRFKNVSKNKLSRTSDSLHNFEVDTLHGIYLKKEDYESYTFKIITPPNEKLNNLVFSKNENGEFDLFRIEYDFTEEEFSYLTQSELNNKKTKYYPLEIDQTNARVHMEIVCVEFWVLDYTINGQGESYTSGVPTWVLEASYCESVMINTNDGGGGGGFGTNNPGNSNNPGGSSGGGGAYGPGNPPIITPPVSTKPSYNDQTSNCNRLKFLIKSRKNGDPPSPNIKPKLQALRSQLNPERELGFRLKKTGNQYTNPDIPITNTTGKSVSFRTGLEIYGAVHTHPTIGADPMFSWGDVYGLSKIYEETASENKTSVVLILVCQDKEGNQKIYAIKINDFDALKQKLDDDLAEAEGNSFWQKKRWIHINKYTPLFQESDHNHVRAFLNYFGGNISLYEINNDFTNWSKLDMINPDSVCCSEITKTNCN
ncbi:hypothetical protein GV828_05080 [Flavobacterium sp. NST-5]|uniref:Uncharacterized protein n=1 Tax=Flavobacterium ichthyis TaxID=2698827 RepID=A0ABW9ZB78_9FLAO|nr:hypothetical protein [Flavobacterium ichthyis]NBL64572.1 hypothetical protein [Flavobacterium ichthyis]